MKLSSASLTEACSNYGIKLFVVRFGTYDQLVLSARSMFRRIPARFGSCFSRVMAFIAKLQLEQLLNTRAINSISPYRLGLAAPAKKRSSSFQSLGTSSTFNPAILQSCLRFYQLKDHNVYPKNY
mmetsp:Transcript_11047/g.13815  ORF Transcript_11047/g.13815 Transcript_11047/m.13815 type:complete len:125 (-) Transcript_11047:549-923(-)